MKLSTPFQASRNRRGFTLLELLLALALGVMLLGALYFSMYMTLQQTQASRDAVDAESTSRAVFNKMGLDLSSVLGPGTPKSGGAPAGGATATVTTAPTTTPTTGTTSSATPTDVSSVTDTSADPTATDDSQSTTQNIAFQVGVIGNGTQLTIFASRVPNILGTPGALSQTSDAQQSSDLVRIDYWKGANGLCRLERPWITADQTGTAFAIDTSTEATSTIAEEVTDVLFQYHDGTSWLESWDTTSGMTPTPPIAISITLTFSRPNPQGGEPITKKVSQTIAVRTAPGSTVPELVDPVLSSGVTPESSDTSSGGSTTTGGSTSGTKTGGSK